MTDKFNDKLPTERPPRKKANFPPRSKFPGKEAGSISFNLTMLGRQLLKQLSSEASVSNGDYVEMLVRERAGLPPIQLPAEAKQTGARGGAKSFFFGKDRGTTTAVCVTPYAHKLLDDQVAVSGMSRGDYIEYLLREKGGVPFDQKSTPETVVDVTPQVRTTPQVSEQLDFSTGNETPTEVETAISSTQTTVTIE